MGEIHHCTVNIRDLRIPKLDAYVLLVFVGYRSRDVRHTRIYIYIPSGYLTVCHGIDGPFIDGLPGFTY